MFGELRLDENFKLESLSHINCGGSFTKDFANEASVFKSDCRVEVEGFDLNQPTI